MNRFRFLILVIFGLALRHSSEAAPLSGTRSVGPTGDYTSLTAAIADVQAQTLGGALILELQSAYVSTVETFPLTIPALNGASASNTLTIRPASGATALSITSADTTAATVDLNGAQFVTIDGRPAGVGSNAGSGVGSASQLTIANTSTSGVALRFINEASTNTITYTTLRGVNTSASSGTVIFSTTTGTNGNDNNTIDHCDICDGASTPTNGIYSSGSTGTAAQNNSNNTVSSNNIYNFYRASAVDSAGVRLDGGSTDWGITDNSFYQAASRGAFAASVRGIYVNNSSGNNFNVTGNFIGGTTANAGGAAWTTTGTSSAYRFAGIHMNVGTTTASSVEGNVVRNMVWTSSSTASAYPGVWGGIYVQTGTVDIGSISGNTIGSGSGTGSISVTTSGTGGTVYGVCAPNGVTVTVVNNIIGSITASGSTSSVSASITAIAAGVLLNTVTISGNVIGSTTTANSLNAATSSSSATSQQVTGITTGGNSFGTLIITGNTVANLNNNYVGTATGGQVCGIINTEGRTTISGNTVRNLTTTSNNTSSSPATVSVLGIAMGVTAGNVSLSGNVVHSLINNAISTNVSVIGIYYSGAAGGSNVIARNLVHSLSIASGSASASLHGMYFGGGAFTAQNNMLRVGLDFNGVSTAGASVVIGISDANSTTSGRNFYHNSVYVGGSEVSGTSNSFAVQSTGVTNARDFRNNILVNARGNAGGSGKHYAASYGGTTVNPAGLTSNSNIFFVSGSGGVLGLYNGANRTTLATWQVATGQDGSSALANPAFVNPTGTAVAVDLHLQSNNPAANGGLPIAAVTDDFDGTTRSLIHTDIGADASSNFSSTGDIYAPSISYPPLSNGSSASRTLTGWVTSIVDNSGVVNGGGSAPRLYYKKSTDADVFAVANNSSGNGWKYVTATGSGPYSFTMDYSLINGGRVAVGDTIQYFVVAQDAASNLGSNPPGATASINPLVQNVNGHGALNSFSVVASLSGTKTVGTGGDYSSLSGSGGLFAAINGGILTGNVTVNIISDATETGSVSLNNLITNEYPPSTNYTLMIRPDSATMRTLSGSINGAIVVLNGASNIVIDGSFGGSGRYLTFRNTSVGVSANAVLFSNDASNNTLRSSIFEGESFSGSVVRFGDGKVTGNNNNLITDCQVRDPSVLGSLPKTLIYSAGSYSSGANSGNTISHCDLFNFDSEAVKITVFNNDSWTISGNNIYEVKVATVPVTAIDMEGGGINTISDNYIHDLYSQSGTGIYFAGTGTTAVSRNRIVATNLDASTTTFYGIYSTAGSGTTLNTVNNQIVIFPSTSSTMTVVGIYDSSYGAFTASYNSIVVGGVETGTASSWASKRTHAGAHNARNNIFLNFRSGGGVSHYAAGSESTGGSYTATNNVYAGTGSTSANFMDFGSGTTTPVSFTNWQSSTGDTSSSAGNPGGNYTTAMFVNVGAGELHLVPGGNVLVNRAGVPIAGVTDDYDGDLRSVTMPTIGSDEIPLADISVTQTGTVIDGGSIDFGTVTIGGSSVKTFTITNPGTADLTGLAFATADGANPGDFTVSALSGTSVPASGGSVTFTVAFVPGAGGTRSAAIHITSNVTGAKNPFDIVLTGTGQTAFAAWAGANGVGNDPNATGGNGISNLLNFSFGVNPATGGNGALQYTGTFAGNGTISVTGQPTTKIEGGVIRALFVRRKDFVTAGLTYTVQFSNDLSSWQDSGDTPAVLADDGLNQIVSVPFPSGFSTDGFFRVRVSLP